MHELTMPTFPTLQESQVFAGTYDDLMPVFVVAIAATAAVLLTWISVAAKARQRGLDLIDAALKNPNVSTEAQRELVRSLRPTPGRRTFIAGWFGLFAGVSWLCTEPRGDELTAAIIFTVMSFALLTLPLALRELETRRA